MGVVKGRKFLSLNICLQFMLAEGWTIPDDDTHPGTFVLDEEWYHRQWPPRCCALMRGPTYCDAR